MLKIIAAMAGNRVIGNNGSIPWELHDDMKWFQGLTNGKPVVMGSKTYWSLSSRYRPLPNRENIVITRHPSRLAGEAVTILDNFNEILKLSKRSNVFVMGGAEIYALALPHADEMYLTRVEAEPVGDTFFPVWEEKEWQLVSTVRHPQDEKNEYAFHWEVWRHRNRWPAR